MRAASGYIVALCGAAIIAFCVYVDRERHRDPGRKKKLRDKKMRLKKETLPHYEIVPTTIDPQFREAMIINEIEVAEKLMALEKWDEAMVHFAHAISVCADPGHLLNCLKQTLPPASYEMLMHLLTTMYESKMQQSTELKERRETVLMDGVTFPI